MIPVDESTIHTERPSVSRPVAGCLVDHHQPVGMRVRQGFKEDAIHGTKNRRARADAQSNRQNNNDRKAGGLSQHAQAETEIMDQNVDKTSAKLFAAFFLEPLV